MSKNVQQKEQFSDTFGFFLSASASSEREAIAFIFGRFRRETDVHAPTEAIQEFWDFLCLDSG